MDHALEATLKLIDSDSSKLTRRVYNLGGSRLTPQQFADQIKKKIPEFEMTCKKDHRQAIADSWPGSILDESVKDFGF